MPGPYYVKSSASGTADGSSWANAFTTLAAAVAVDAAGDIIYVSHAHSESLTTSNIFAFAGTANSPVLVVCGVDAAAPPSMAATSASITTTSTMALNGSVYIRGITFTKGSGTSGLPISINTASDHRQHYRDCTFALGGTGAGGRIRFGQDTITTNKISDTYLENCFVSFSSASQRVAAHNGCLKWVGGGLVGGSALTVFLDASGTGAMGGLTEVEGLDLTGLSTSAALCLTAAPSLVSFRNCKLPASWMGTLHSGVVPVGARVAMYNCDSGATNYRLWIEDYYGSIKQETTLVKTGGASNGATGLALKMESNTKASYPLGVLCSPEIVRQNSTVGSPVTMTVDVLHDSATALKNDEIWMVVQYLSSSGSPISSYISCAKSDTLTGSASHPASSATWTTTGMTNPNKQELSVTFTPQMAGYLHARVFLAKASTTLYVDYKPAVA